MNDEIYMSSDFQRNKLFELLNKIKKRNNNF